ncbi:MAG TPA: DUF4416 family protein, partial [bacterium]|nr:DUF4416 family protein [bacterium]
GELKKIFFSFETLTDPARFADIKTTTNEIEQKHLQAGSRRINLDPGFLTLAKVLLATTKDNVHRIYLRDGIFAEVTLFFRKKTFTPFEWTYPDYRTEGYIEYFNNLREIYRAKLAANGQM